MLKRKKHSNGAPINKNNENMINSQEIGLNQMQI